MVERMQTQGMIGRWFYVGAAVLLCLLCIVAFAPSLVYPAGRSLPLPLPPLATAHAMLGVCWLFVFVLQVVLVARGRTPDHRRLGIVGIVLIGLFLVTGIVTVFVQAQRGYDASGDLRKLPLPPGTDAQMALLGQLYFLAVFGVLTGLGIRYRRRPAVHKRLMLLGIVGGLIPTPVAPLDWSLFGVAPVDGSDLPSEPGVWSCVNTDWGSPSRSSHSPALTLGGGWCVWEQLPLQCRNSPERGVVPLWRVGPGSSWPMMKAFSTSFTS